MELVTDFEECAPSRWHATHRDHLAITLWYLGTLPEIDATERIIGGIQRNIHATETRIPRFGGYHETMTLFWITIARHFCEECNRETSLLQRTNDFVRAFGDRGHLFRNYYTSERMFSWKARQTWVEPDRQPLKREHVRQSGGFVLL
jgi:hypothetical protein